MAFPFDTDVPLVSATKFNVPAQAVDDGSNVYGTPVYAPASSWVLGNTLQGRKLLVTVNTGALTSTPTALKVYLAKGTTSSGGSITAVTGTETEWTTPAGNTSYSTTIDLSAATFNATDYYSLALASNGAGSTSVIAGATARYLDKVHQS